ncbi:bifunctional sugar-1-phosphate nucleotidylyltransferase/acetyltransferase [Chloroflexota bacterium]
MIEQAIILAAGEGQRLKPFTAFKPKVMIHIANKPILHYVVDAVAKNGIRNIVIVVGYRKEHVIDYFGSGEQFGVHIDYIDQRQQLGTAHALKQVEGKVSGTFLAISGDNIIHAETVSSMVQAKPNTILVKEQENISKYGVIEANDGLAINIIEKPREARSNLVNLGVYAFTEDIFHFIEQETDMVSVIKRMISCGNEISVCKTNDTWLDVVYPWDVLKLNDLALVKTLPATGGTIERGAVIKGQVSIGKGTIIRSNSYILGPALIGQNCEIGPSVCVLPSTSIGDNVCIFPFTLVSNSVITNDVEIGPSSTIQDSIIDQGCKLGGHFVASSGKSEVKVDDEYHQVQIGAMLGENCRTEDSVVTSPGVIVGNRCQINALKVLRGRIPDESIVV